LISGSNYKFRVRARNEFGYSEYSDELQLLVAFVPARPVPPVTSVINSTVIVTWTAPFDSGSPITKYKITIRQSDGVYSESSHCDGTVEARITARSCSIPLDSLTSGVFNLV